MPTARAVTDGNGHQVYSDFDLKVGQSGHGVSNDKFLEVFCENEQTMTMKEMSVKNIPLMRIHDALVELGFNGNNVFVYDDAKYRKYKKTGHYQRNKLGERIKMKPSFYVVKYKVKGHVLTIISGKTLMKIKANGDLYRTVKSALRAINSN